MFLVCILTLLSGCGSSRYAYFQPQRNAVQRVNPTTADLVTSVDTLTPLTVSGLTTEPTATSSSTAVTATATRIQTTAAATAQLLANPSRHRNPESYRTQRFGRWFRSLPLAHVAPRTHMIDRNSPSRKTYKLALVALGFAVLSFGSLFLAGGGVLMLVTEITLPLTATLLGTASLATIKRNPDRFRGKGWAMAAIMIGTGLLGLALVALAALSVSETISR
ncbi:hypothetical protein GCM10028825_42570 [Spirosoma agri]